MRAQNTHFGTPSFSSNTTGTDDSAFGWKALDGNTKGSQNTAVGSLAVQNNQVGTNNTGTGHAALQGSVVFDANHNRIPNNGSRNTAVWDQAISSVVAGNDNTAAGYLALLSNWWSSNNTAMGSQAMRYTSGYANTAIGMEAMRGSTNFNNNSGGQNTASGFQALYSDAGGGGNTADGYAALLNNVWGYNNTGTGFYALLNATGSFNTALGQNAGSNIRGGSYNIDIGSSGDANDGTSGFPATIRIGDSNQKRTFISGIYNNPVTNNNPQPVYIDSFGQLGSPTSSERFKKDIKPMNQASETILQLTPVAFRYKSDTTNTPQFGLIAEDVEKVDSALVIRDGDGKLQSVRYDAVNAMLLNEFLKEHRKVEDQQTTIAQLKSEVAQQQKRLETLAAGLAKVSAQVEATKPVTRLVDNRQ